MAQHYMTWPTANTAVCGADMTGQRNSATDCNTGATTCPACCDWIDARDADEYAADVETYRAECRDHNL